MTTVTLATKSAATAATTTREKTIRVDDKYEYIHHMWTSLPPKDLNCFARRPFKSTQKVALEAPRPKRLQNGPSRD